MANSTLSTSLTGNSAKRNENQGLLSNGKNVEYILARLASEIRQLNNQLKKNDRIGRGDVQMALQAARQAQRNIGIAQKFR